MHTQELPNPDPDGMMLEHYDVDYFHTHKETIEHHLSSAMDSVFASKPANPLAVIGQTLLDAAATRDAPDAADTELLFSVKRVVENMRLRQAASDGRSSPALANTTEGTSEEGEDSLQWGLRSWLESMPMASLVEEALKKMVNNCLEELHEGSASSLDRATEREVQFEFVKSLGEHSSYEPIARMLQVRALRVMRDV